MHLLQNKLAAADDSDALLQEPSPYEFGILLGLEMGLKATPKVRGLLLLLQGSLGPCLAAASTLASSTASKESDCSSLRQVAPKLQTQPAEPGAVCRSGARTSCPSTRSDVRPTLQGSCVQ